MAEAQDKDDKTEEPTPRRLEEARQKGDVARSQEVGTFAVLAAATFGLIALGGGASEQLARTLHAFFERPHAIATDGGGLAAVFALVSGQVALAVGGVFGLLFVAAAFGNVAQFGLLWTGEKLKPKLDKVSPIEGFKRLFGGEAWVTFGKTLLKVAAAAAAILAACLPNIAAFEALTRLDMAALLPAIRDMSGDLLIAALIVAALIAAIDWVYQQQAFKRRNRMSLQDIRDEVKNTDGDPMIRAKLRQIRQQRARQRMMQNMLKATVVITNPTHYAVALRYEPGETEAPVCLAKGVDAVALRIRAVAEENGIPVMEDPPLARALYASVDLEETIPVEHYKAVAKIIGVIMGLSARRGRSQARAESGTIAADRRA